MPTIKEWRISTLSMISMFGEINWYLTKKKNKKLKKTNKIANISRFFSLILFFEYNKGNILYRINVSKWD